MQVRTEDRGEEVARPLVRQRPVLSYARLRLKRTGSLRRKPPRRSGCRKERTIRSDPSTAQFLSASRISRADAILVSGQRPQMRGSLRRQVAVAVIVAVEEPPCLMPM